jgi:hypothetical protein
MNAAGSPVTFQVTTRCHIPEDTNHKLPPPPPPPSFCRMARQPEVEPSPPLNDASKFACLEIFFSSFSVSESLYNLISTPPNHLSLISPIGLFPTMFLSYMRFPSTRWLWPVHFSLFNLIQFGMPITVAARCKKWTVFTRSNNGIVCSNPTRGMDVCVRLFCVCVVLCVGGGFATGSSPVQGVLPTVYRLRNWKSGQGPQRL